MTRKSRVKTSDRTSNYPDPFKDHMKRMEDKLKYGEAGAPSVQAYGGFADKISTGNRSQAGYLS